MKKIGFVSPWYGEKIPGGAEMEMRGLIEHFIEKGMEVDVLTTCVKEFASDWNVNYHKAGVEKNGQLTIRRFKVRKRNEEAFNAVNKKLVAHHRIDAADGDIFLKEMINSPELYEYMNTHKGEYSLFLFIPYMFGTTYYGCMVCPDKSIVIPCFHDEAYIYIEQYKKAFENVGGMTFLARPESDLANRVFDLSNVCQSVTGAGVDTDMEFEPERFRKKFGISEPFILYAGRKDVGKNIYTLIKYVIAYRQRHEKSELKLVMMGGGDIKIPEEYKDMIIDLGYVDRQDKYDGCAASLAMCQPSKNESFSIVIMESWLCKRPVIVNEKCAVTTNFAKESNAGLYFSDYLDFEGCVDFFLENEEAADKMGEMGREYVLDHFSWDKVIRNYEDVFRKVIENYSAKQEQ